MKTYNIEVQKFKGMSNGNGLINAQIDALVLPLNPAEGKTPTTWLSMSEDNARVRAEFTRRGQVDEEAVYQYLQLWDLAHPVNHGTHVTGTIALLYAEDPTAAPPEAPASSPSARWATRTHVLRWAPRPTQVRPASGPAAPLPPCRRRRGRDRLRSAVAWPPV